MSLCFNLHQSDSGVTLLSCLYPIIGGVSLWYLQNSIKAGKLRFVDPTLPSAGLGSFNKTVILRKVCEMSFCVVLFFCRKIYSRKRHVTFSTATTATLWLMIVCSSKLLIMWHSHLCLFLRCVQTLPPKIALTWHCLLITAMLEEWRVGYFFFINTINKTNTKNNRTYILQTDDSFCLPSIKIVAIWSTVMFSVINTERMN